MRKLSIAIACVVFTGCYTTPVSNSQAKSTPAMKWSSPAEGYATLVVKRDSGFMGAACKAAVYVSGDQIGSIGPSDKVTVYLPPGEYIIGARNGSLCGGAVSEASVVLAANAHKNYRIAIGDMGAIHLQPTAF